MILVLCHRNDEVAAAIYRQLLKQTADVHLITGDDLVFAPYWRQDVSQNGHAITQVRLLNGLLINSTKVEAVHNRLGYLEAIHFLNDIDRAYAQMEFMALYLSFLKSMEHALLVPLRPWQLTAEGLSEMQKQSAAAEAGVPVLDSHFTSSPRWKQTAGFTTMSPTRRSRDVFYRKSPHLLWEDKPVRQIKGTSSIVKATVAGNKVLCDKPLPFEESLRSLAGSLGTIHMDAWIGRTDEGDLCLYEVDTVPRASSSEALAEIATAILQKALQTA